MGILMTKQQWLSDGNCYQLDNYFNDGGRLQTINRTVEYSAHTLYRGQLVPLPLEY